MSTPRSAVKTSLTARRLRRVVENDEFTAFSRRVLRAAGRRVAAGDIDGLPELVALGAAVETVITDAIGALHGAGYSWTEIASRLDITRQAAHQRWAAITAGVSTSEGTIR